MSLNVNTINTVTEAIEALFQKRELPYVRIAHDVCCTSEESFAARKAASGEAVVGAKALLVKCYFSGGLTSFAMVVLPGPATLDGERFRMQSGAKKFRFASPEEVEEITGLVRGCIPPFGPELFSGVTTLFVDTQLVSEVRIGFNAGSLCHSLLVDMQYYQQVLQDPVYF